MSADRAFERLRHANPVEVVAIPRPSAEQFLTDVDASAPATTLHPIRQMSSNSWWLAAAGALVIALVALPVILSRAPGANEGNETRSEILQFAQDVDRLPLDRLTSGQFRVGELGIPFTFETFGSVLPIESSAGYVLLEMRSGGAVTTVGFIRPTELADPTDIFASRVPYTWPVEDLDGWIAALDERITVTELDPVEVDGRTGRAFAITTDPDLPATGDTGINGCSPDVSCGRFAQSAGGDNYTFWGGNDYRIWWFEIEGYAPLFVGASSPSAEFFQRAEDILRSIDFGPDAPSPASVEQPWEYGYGGDVEPTTLRLPALGGIAFDLDRPGSLDQATSFADVLVSPAGNVSIFVPLEDPDGAVIATAEGLVANLRSREVAVTDLGTLSTATGTFRAVDVETRGSTVRYTLNEFGRTWRVPLSGRLWLLDTPRGVVVIAAAATDGRGGLDTAINTGQRIAETFELIDPGSLPTP